MLLIYRDSSQDPRLFTFSREHSNTYHYLNHITRHGEEILSSIGKSAIYAFFPHCGHFDPLVVYGELLDLELHRNLITAAAEDYWFKKKYMIVLGNLMMPMVPMPRPDHGANLMETANALKSFGHRIAEKDESLIWAPEGTRNDNDIKERKLKAGVALLAEHSNRPVVPVVLSGLEKAWPRTQKIFRLEALARNHVDVCFLPPMMWSEFNDQELFLGTLKQRYVQAYQELQQLR